MHRSKVLAQLRFVRNAQISCPLASAKRTIPDGRLSVPLGIVSTGRCTLQHRNFSSAKKTKPAHSALRNAQSSSLEREQSPPKEERRNSGKISYPDGNVYTGEIENEQREGFGTLILADGTVIEGIWHNNEIVKGKQINMELEMLYEG